ncbi:MAG: (2Fe-2S)-binding protein [bacterium]|nr:(2Fe-2S)-binding protein [bacterium]
MNKVHVSLNVNKKRYDLSVEPLKPLSQVLRDDLMLTGSKEGCHKGECGACTVIMDSRTVDSCLVPVCQAHGSEIITIEGISADVKELHPVQKAFMEEGAVQCGFCTPGLIMSSVDLLDRIPRPDEEQIKEALSGNLCRCTGYAKIIKAVRKAAQKKAGT